MLEERSVGRRRDERLDQQRQDRRFEVGMSPPTTTTRPSRGEEARQAGEWAFERRLVVDQPNADRQGGATSGGDDDDVGGDGGHGFGGMVEQRPAIDRYGQFVAAEARADRPPARTIALTAGSSAEVTFRLEHPPVPAVQERGLPGSAEGCRADPGPRGSA